LLQVPLQVERTGIEAAVGQPLAQQCIKAMRVGPRLVRIERESLLALATPVGNY
jgi:hypothetical protein